MEEKDMYPIVEDFFKEKLKNLKFNENILSGYAPSPDLFLSLYGAYIKPDVYTIGEDKDGIYRLIMGEGKITLKGRDLDGLIWQGTSDSRFSHYVYLFVPENELNGDMLEFMKFECKKYGLGLLSIDITNKKINQEIIEAEISPYFLDKNTTYEFQKNILLVKNQILINLGVAKDAKYAHLATLRDLAILLCMKKQWNINDIFTKSENILLNKYKKRQWKSSLDKYNPKVRIAINGNIDKFKEIVQRNLDTLHFFDLLNKTIDVKTNNLVIEIKPNLRVFASFDLQNKFSNEEGDYLRKFLTFLLLISEGTKKLTHTIYEILKSHKSLPVYASKRYCPKYRNCNRDCGFRGKWTIEGQKFYEGLEYNLQQQSHICDINGTKFSFNKKSVTSILYSKYKMNLPERLKILISESTLVEQEGRPHRWILGKL